MSGYQKAIINGRVIRVTDEEAEMIRNVRSEKDRLSLVLRIQDRVRSEQQ